MAHINIRYLTKQQHLGTTNRFMQPKKIEKETLLVSRNRKWNCIPFKTNIAQQISLLQQSNYTVSTRFSTAYLE